MRSAKLTLATCAHIFSLSLLSLFAVISSGVPAHAQLHIGVFSDARAGDTAFGTSSRMSTIRSDIQTGFPGVTFSTTDTLTPAFLSSVDVVMISSATGNNSGFALSNSEQSSLLAFVKSGKGAVILTDNDTFDGGGTVADNQSFLSPFGVHSTGTLATGQNVTITSPSTSAVTNGPFGMVSSFGTFYPGWFDALGVSAQSLGRLDANGQTALADIPKNGLAPGSGGVVLFSDVSFLANDFFDSHGAILVENALAFVTPSPTSVPESGSIVLLVSLSVTGAGFLARRRKQACKDA